MKLKCKTHDSRVLVLTDQTVIHRSKADECSDSVLVIGGMDIRPLTISMVGAGLGERSNRRSKA